jgi:SpoVK/Ycf46/Vps4 family AAA+-type ATPase
LAFLRTVPACSYIAPPDLLGREQIFRINLARVPQDDSINTQALASSTAGFSGQFSSQSHFATLLVTEQFFIIDFISGADIAHVVREACMSVLKELRGGVGPVSQRHLLKAASDTVRVFDASFSLLIHLKPF